jgi:hypothetical protein
LNGDLFDFVIDDDFLNFLSHRFHSIIKIIVQTITRRVAAGWLVLPFQGEKIDIFANHKNYEKHEKVYLGKERTRPAYIQS